MNQWPLEWQASNERWSLVWSAPQACAAECQAQADQWWRMHRALGRKAIRVERLRLSEQQQKVLPGKPTCNGKAARRHGWRTFRSGWSTLRAS
ncbi:hypothetical protein HLB35_09350 [Halomonas sp. TBZ9]|uniref:Uncharacterized protein n=1 Tax=Vreelandella azerica TaxID=2732867 RepID=A0A7Y3TY50_9GAMM|nr:hypothetical protein [Halomonas azerica]NOG31915.1 hypothetical protein [Halomonas azerica]